MLLKLSDCAAQVFVRLSCFCQWWCLLRGLQMLQVCMAAAQPPASI